MLRKILLSCGILSSLWYFMMNILAPVNYEGYEIASYTVSELSAISAPSRKLWVTLGLFFIAFLVAFGIGVWLSAGGDKRLKVAGLVIIVDALLGFFWPPMHRREVLAAGGGTLTDTLHLVWAGVHLAMMLVMIGFGAAALGRGFRIYSLLTIVVFLAFGILTGRDSPGVQTGQPTPYIGIWERINIFAYMVWVIVFAVMLMQKRKHDHSGS